MCLGTHGKFEISTISKDKISMCFSSGTKETNSYFNSQNFNFGFYGCLVVDYVGRSGGLILLWKKEVDLEFICYSISFIHSRVRDSNSGND